MDNYQQFYEKWKVKEKNSNSFKLTLDFEKA